MHKELFGVFGGRPAFEARREDRSFDAVVSGPAVTVGVRDPDLGAPGRTTVHSSVDGVSAVWGEAFAPDGADSARWILERYRRVGTDAFDALGGSYVAAVDPAGRPAAVVTDPPRSQQCYYADAGGVRAFGTDGAAVARTLDAPAPDRTAIRQFLHLGIVLGNRTLAGAVRRVPFDGLLRADGVESLRRFVYRPCERDHARALATALERAVERRAGGDGRTGVMLSAGFDSRTLLAGLDDVDRCFTIGEPDGAEARTAHRLASQYGVPHTAFAPDERYLRPEAGKVRYSQGVRESLHAHHAGYADRMDVDEMFHGLWYDTLLRGHFLPRQSVSVLGRKLPVGHLASDPDPVETLLDTFPYRPGDSRAVDEVLPLGAGDADSFVRDSVAAEFDRYADRADRVANRLAVTGVSNSPAITFHHHLADNFREWFVAVDRSLLTYHLTTPPESRSTGTFLDACRRLDPDLLDVRPPGRPHDSRVLNALDGFARRILPGVAVPDRAWPDRNDRYEAEGLDELLFPDEPAIRALPPRHKLRLHDVRAWLARADVAADGSPDLVGSARDATAGRRILSSR